ncbi:MAG: DUF4242 domain-containing protein [Rothia sp. (in: high G+C Gram-positive bacteria)]|uniref:DUF4242 domain-containing protein n=1 Tax=Rothia sp. (in: high G+C Gram-positive bacteria) TaxID=1885016 RepID=UPI0026DFEADC|nr:DUF4242 domain-containing protein [Rothia sp. (in: high G+C Gram-positive bacteria)]MDO5749672.1 DUF4242 domain-containing protein [Rothia sp. (in: high G+C Gram-positive bacteria)]
MALYLVELTPASASKEEAEALISTVNTSLSGGELIETQVASDHKIIFVIIEAENTEFAQSITDAIGERASIAGPDEVRLVGAELEDIKKLKKDADYLVEWDIPAEITMEQYLTRKKANSPKYAEVPEVSFLRTYVREDTAKCLCFYDAPDEDAVVRARQAVSTPIDRLFKLHA